MEKKNYVKYEWNMDSERPRKVYALTNNGKAMLEYTAGSLRAICKTIGANNSQLDAAKNMQLNIAFNPKKNEPHSITR